MDFSRDYPAIRFEVDNSALGGDSHTYPPAVELFNQGSFPADVYLVQSGIVKLTRCEANGQEILLDLRFPGSLVGSAAVISEKPHLFGATTVTRCTVTRWTSPNFLKLMATDVSVAARVRKILSDEVLDHVVRISQLTCLPARQRLEQLLWQFCERAQPNDSGPRAEGTSRLHLPLKHYEIAHLLSITPAYLCRLLNALEKESVINRSKGWIIVREPAALRPVSPD
jgi:CRP/FNR family transcriptional regulator